MKDHLFEKYGREFEGGDVIFCEYEPGNNFYLIREGRVKLVKVVDEREKILDIISDGDVFGEMAILEEAPRSATALAYKSKVKVLEFNKANFEVLLMSHPMMVIKLLKTFSKRIFEAKRRLETLNFKDEEVKVLDTLLMLKDQKGLMNSGGDGVSDLEVKLEATIEQIADWCAVDLDKTQKILEKHELVGRLRF